MEGTKISFSDIFDEIQSIADKISDPSVKKVYCAACVTMASMVINQTDPMTDMLSLSFEDAYNDIQSFKIRNGI